MRFAMLREKSLEVDILLSAADKAPVEVRRAFTARVVRSISLKRPFDDLRYRPALATRELMGEIRRSGATNGKLWFRHAATPPLACKIESKLPAIKPSGPEDIPERRPLSRPDFEAA
jgi:hypothetical protein